MEEKIEFDAVKRYSELRETMCLTDAIIQLQVEILDADYKKHKQQQLIEEGLRPCDCKDEVTAKKLNEQGLMFNGDSIRIDPLVVILEMGNTTIKIPMHRFKQFAEWYLKPQSCELPKDINKKKMRLKTLLDLNIKDCLSELESLYTEKEPTDEEYHKWAKFERAITLCLDQMLDGLSSFDWQYVIDHGYFCMRDFEYFGQQIKEKTGICSYEEAHKIYTDKCKQEEQLAKQTQEVNDEFKRFKKDMNKKLVLSGEDAKNIAVGSDKELKTPSL